MIIIKKPKLQMEDQHVVLSYPFSIDGKEQILWYKIPESFRDYVVAERLDAALVGLLFLGLKTGNDIRLEGAVSSRLFYTISHYLIDALILSNSDYKRIKIEAEQLDDTDINNEKVAGTGMSCGVDSFASYYDHENSQKHYKTKYFTFYNVGSHGDFGGDNARNIYFRRLERINLFAKKVNKEVVEIDSNLSEILRLNFQRTHTLRSISCVLILQKLFRTFYYASSVRFDNFELDKIRIAEFDLLNLQMLSTESTQFYSSAAQYSRVERIKIISNKSDTYDHLDVCVNIKNDSHKINCSRCHKCVRTMITLEILERLKNYHVVFDLEDYKRNRSKHLGELLCKVNKETLDDEVLALIKKERITVPLESYYYGFIYRYRYYKNLFKKEIKKKVKSVLI